ncbi:MAG: hypothetical protein OIF50_08230 [Flavobacteriaceae bacterium]|nr:hypothetical protein [Flavobacteriaceae bacterium]
MANYKQAIIEKYKKKSSEELQDIVHNRSTTFRPTEINAMVSILQSRGIEVDTSKIEYSAIGTHTYNTELQAKSIRSFGILFLLFNIGLVILGKIVFPDLNIIFSLIRLIIVIIAVNMAYKYAKSIHRSGLLWGIIVFFFSGIGLILLSYLEEKPKK